MIIHAMIPSPPNWISPRITIFPNTLQVVAVGTVTRPVTHTDVVAVNNASSQYTPFPLADETGRHKRSVPSMITTPNPVIIILSVGVCHCLFFCFSDILFSLLSYIFSKISTFCFISDILQPMILLLESEICIILRKKSVVNDMAALIFKTVVIWIFRVHKADHQVKFSVVHRFHRALRCLTAE